MAFAPLLRTKEQRIALGFSFVSLLAIGFLPLFAGFTYEFALACGLLVPGVCAVATALDVVSKSPVPNAAFQRALSSGLTHAALACAVALLHGLRSGFCDLLGQLVLFTLGPLFGIVLGGVWGAFVGLVVARAGNGLRVRLLAVALSLAAPALGVALSLIRYYQSPIIFAFDPFVGYFAGTLYDTKLDGTERLLSYRAGSLGLLALAFGASTLLTRNPKGQLEWRLREHPGALLLAIAGALTSLIITLRGEALGHYQTAASIRNELGHVAVSERCEVVYAAGILQRDAHALARECDEHVKALEAYFETQTAPQLTVFLFASSGQKARLMGARNVYIAKPWRHEVYLQARGYPHPVLGHELAHIVAGSFARGPFKVAGPLGGWIPDPGRIEGFAEAAAPREGEDLSPMQWAKAMRELSLLPPLARVFKLSFFGENASKAYTVAGAFVGWLKREHGAEAIRRWYAGESLETVFGKELTTLEQEFHTALDALKVSDVAMEVARARFDRPAVFGRSCPHQVDTLHQKADKALGRLDPTQARELYAHVLELDPHHYAARVGLGDCELREGDIAAAREHYEKLAADESLAASMRAYATERAADAALLAGDLAAARKGYQQAARAFVDEDQLRHLDVKLWIEPGMKPDSPARRAISALLIGDPMLGTDWAIAGAELGRWSEQEPKLGLADYLLGKNYFQRGRWDDAARVLDQALSRELPLPRVQREAQRVRLFTACALGQKARAQQVFDDYKKSKGIAPQRLAAVQRFAGRCGLSTNSR